MTSQRTIKIKGNPQRDEGTVEVVVRYTKKAITLTETPFGQVLDLDDSFLSGEPGEPAFPVQQIRVALPPYSDVLNVEAEVSNVREMTRAPVFIAPIQEMRPAMPTRVKIKKSLYRESPPAVKSPSYVKDARGVTTPHFDSYRNIMARPAPAATLVDIEHRGPATIAVLELRPVSQNPQGIIELASVISVSLLYQPVAKVRKGSFAGRRFFKKARSSFEELKIENLLKSNVINPNWIRDLSNLFPDFVGGCDYLVITDNNSWDADSISAVGSVGDLVSTFEKLVEWKKRRGLKTRIVTVADIVEGKYGDFVTDARDLQEVLRIFLKWAYNQWNVSWVLLGGDLNVIPTRLVAGANRGYIAVDTVNPPDDDRSFWTGTELHMHVVNPGEWWPGNWPHQLVNPADGTLIPLDTAGISNATNPGWFYATDNTYNVRSNNRTQFVVVRGPAALVNNTLQWLYQWNILPTDMYYSSLIGPNYGLSGLHDWDILDNGLYGQHTNGNNFDGVSFSVDVGLGRAPVGSVTEAEVFVKKVIAYEQLREPDGTPLDLNWARRMTLVSTNIDNRDHINIMSTATSPPTVNRYHHDAGDAHTLIKLGDVFTDLKWHLFVQVTPTDVREIPYTPEADVTGRGWFFAKSDTDLSPSEIIFSLPWGVFRYPIATEWVVVYGNSDELAPSRFIFDKAVADTSMNDQEALCKLIQDNYSAINVLSRIYEDEIDLPPSDVVSPPLQHYTQDRMRDALNLGPHFLSLSGHGSQGGCCGVDSAMAQNASNGYLLPVTYAMSCLTADFATEDATSEKLLHNASGGAVAYVGYTRFGWIGVGDDYEREFFKHLGTSRHLADLNDARLNLNYSGGSWRWHQFVQVLLGDPEMPVWVGKPKVMKVTHSASIKKVAQDVIVTVTNSSNAALAGAVVSLAKGNWVKSDTTDATGEASIHVNPQTTGDIEVVVTATDRVPYFGTIEVKEGFICRSNILCRSDILCRNLIACGPSVTCGEFVSCGAAILCRSSIGSCPSAVACGLMIGGCRVGIGGGCPNIDPVPFEGLLDLFEACRVRDIKELATKRNTRHVKKVIESLNPASRRSLEQMLARIETNE
ncbi:MAG: C25 family cysteine peptidase [Desulfococcaceae bacterium]